ncbi:hypothetical protein [Streptomyces fulvorobeus]|uniref:ANTAR domain-containing protein n=1 Tax=Streptomyces fulvorobeus TaxID=284028 RepID=A0A7J0BZV9_9ACTN|nr:hypothetical protein [Streptomyces fulvorobeus]NYE39059.1 hypothetical protein [Streptomyces fulvorobeus]GFM95254.1 hypothetical protein Sfulv_00650 [Streptomyces fulvorobeus]
MAVPTDEGLAVLREVSQHTNTKLTAVAEQLLEHAQGAQLPEDIQTALRHALTCHNRDRDWSKEGESR